MGTAGITGYHDTSLASGPGVTVGRSGVGSMGVCPYSPVDYWPHNTVLYVTDFRGNDERFTSTSFSTWTLRRFNSGSAASLVEPELRLSPPNTGAATVGAASHRPHPGHAGRQDRVNRRMNETLEAMARQCSSHGPWTSTRCGPRWKAASPPAWTATAALFPDAFQDSPLGKMPKGWRVGRESKTLRNVLQWRNPQDMFHGLVARRDPVDAGEQRT